MTAVAIQGIGVAGAFGAGIDQWRAALEGRRPVPGELTLAAPGGPLRVPALLADDTPLQRFMAPRALRRADHFSRLGLLGAHLALEDAGLLGADLSGLGLVVASGFGASASTFALVDSIIEAGDPCASPIHFANSLHNAAAANIAIQLKAGGPNLTVSQFRLSVASAMLTARLWLLEGRAERMLFGAVDELSELTGYLRHRQPRPGLPGEGAAFFVLSARPEDGARYGCLESVELGCGWGGGGGHLVLAGPCPDLAQPHGSSCFAELRGDSPVAPALDLAAAALLGQRGRTFQGDLDLEGGPITVLQLEEAGAYGAITLRPATPCQPPR